MKFFFKSIKILTCVSPLIVKENENGSYGNLIK